MYQHREDSQMMRLRHASPLSPLALLGALLAPAVPAGSAEAIEIRDGRETFPAVTPGVEFPRSVVVVDGDRRLELTAVGSGVRKQLLFKVYEIAVYAETGVDLGPNPDRTMIEGRFARHLKLRFLRSTTGEKVCEAYENGFARVLDTVSPRLAEDKARLLGFFENGVEEGNVIELTWIRGDGLYVHIEGSGMPRIDNDELARAMFAIWFGDEPVSGDLKRDMLRLVR
jgi:hypothetical protein